MPVKYHLGEFPPRELDWHRLSQIIGPANAGLARYDGLLAAMPNANVLLSPLTTQEAVLSSKIEGTQVTMGEVLEFEAGGDPENVDAPKRADAEEVLNYRMAMHSCVGDMKDRPFSQHILRGAHQVLMQGVRGKDKSPGSYRLEQNWIGPEGGTIEQAKFVPVAPEHLQSGMDVWERYFNEESDLDALVQLAIVHLEFEALHPFKDGNGRLGRMLLPLNLFQRRLLASPNFYMSGYLDANRDEYLERMRAVSRDGSWTDWCIFFLNGVLEQSAENERKVREILKLYNQSKLEVSNLTHSQYSIKALDFIFQTPIFSAPQFTERSNIPKATAARILGILRKEGILKTIREGKGRRFGVFAFAKLINIAEGNRVF
ncbi:MAG: Fic family protein [Verrucomicrobia bacterium]|nr:Fic family protein [Verrucomicrobiota bacterium]